MREKIADECWRFGLDLRRREEKGKGRQVEMFTYAVIGFWSLFPGVGRGVVLKRERWVREDSGRDERDEAVTGQEVRKRVELKILQ